MADVDFLSELDFLAFVADQAVVDRACQRAVSGLSKEALALGLNGSRACAVRDDCLSLHFNTLVALEKRARLEASVNRGHIEFAFAMVVVDEESFGALVLDRGLGVLHTTNFGHKREILGTVVFRRDRFQANIGVVGVLLVWAYWLFGCGGFGNTFAFNESEAFGAMAVWLEVRLVCVVGFFWGGLGSDREDSAKCTGGEESHHG
jgi:hypothetical protein